MMGKAWYTWIAYPKTTIPKDKAILSKNVARWNPRHRFFSLFTIIFLFLRIHLYRKRNHHSQLKHYFHMEVDQEELWKVAKMHRNRLVLLQLYGNAHGLHLYRVSKKSRPIFKTSYLKKIKKRGEKLFDNVKLIAHLENLFSLHI